MIENVELEPEYDAVKVTDVAVLTFPAVTANVPDVDPCGMTTLDGMFAPAGDPLRPTVAPPLNAAELRLTVQVDPADGLTESGLHEKLLNLGLCRIVTLPPDADAERAVPAGVAAAAFPNWTSDDPFSVEADKPSVTAATVPLEIVVSLRPQATQVMLPAPLAQESDLFAIIGPAATLAEEKSLVEY